MTGLIKSIFGIDKASKEQKEARLYICSQCPESTKNQGKLTPYSNCLKCLCFIDLKTGVKSEKCPLDKW